nr:putative RNA-directed DNA polymerase [Tanacetum cinerariifolium]
TSTSLADTAPTPTDSSSQATNFPITSQDVDELNTQQQHAQQQGNQAPIQHETVADNVLNAMFDANTFVNPFANPSISAAASSSSQYNDREDIGKLGAQGDIGFFIGYSTDSCAYRVYNRRTKKIMEAMNVSFDELSVMAFEQHSSKPGLQNMTSGQISSGLDLTYAPSTITSQQPTEGEFDLLFKAMYDDYIGGQPSAAPRTISATQAPQVRQTSMTSTSLADTAPTPTDSSSQ